MIDGLIDKQEVSRIGYENAAILIRRAMQHRRGLQMMCEPYEPHPHVLVPMKNVYHPVGDQPVQEHYDLSDQYCKAIDEFLADGISMERCFAIMGMKKPL